MENDVCSESVKDVGGRGINLRVITYQRVQKDILIPSGYRWLAFHTSKVTSSVLSPNQDLTKVFAD